MDAHPRDSRESHGSFIVDHRGTLLGFDQAMENLTGWSSVDVVGRNKERIGPLGTSPLYEGEIRSIDDRGRLAIALHGRDGRQVEVEAVVQRLRGGGKQLVVTVLRVVGLSARPELHDRARTDPLTRLPGAAEFRAALDRELGAAAKRARPLALVRIDVDRLRRVNDALGHGAGDGVLRRLAGIFRVTVPDDRHLFRLADDDFALLMPGAGRGAARRVAAALRSTVERCEFFAHGEPRITLSLGAASFPADADTAEDLLARSSEALDEARALGRNRVWCFVRRPRVTVQVPVFFDGDDSPQLGYTRDLSPSGLFVQTSAPIDIGMRCALAFPLPGHTGRVHVIGRVVRRVPPELAAGLDLRIPGMGVEFERFGGASDRRAIEAFLHVQGTPEDRE